jgi:hypothetical protein
VSQGPKVERHVSNAPKSRYDAALRYVKSWANYSLPHRKEQVPPTSITKDTLQFNSTLFSNFAAAMNAASQVGANTVFTIDANDTVTLDNVTKTGLTASNFHFS